MNFVTSKEACNYFKINPTTLKVWKDKGKIKTKKFSSKKFLYDIDSLNSTDNIDHRYNVIYARVSNIKQQHDLNNQIELIKSYMLSNGIKCDKIYKDIASGMNEERKEFNLLLHDIFQGNIKNVYISFKDRLTRFGFKYFEYIFSEFNVNIIILDEVEETNKDFQSELSTDLISIIHHFSMKLYSSRRKKLKEIKNIINKTEINN
jgi:putative transposase orfA